MKIDFGQHSSESIRSAVESIVRDRVPEIANLLVALPMEQRSFANGPICNVLVETQDFFARKDGASIQSALESATGGYAVKVSFVPPRFISTNADGTADARASLRSLRQYEMAASKRLQPSAKSQVEAMDGGGKNRTYRIVSLADLRSVAQFRERHRRQLSQMVNANIIWEHLCVPPSPLLLSDLIFYDYFEPRLPHEQFSAISEAIAKIRAADLIVIDDGAEMLIAPRQIFGVLSHALQRNPETDLIAVRKQRYAARHHELPLTIVAGMDLRLSDRTSVLALLAEYLGKPIFRIAGLAPFAKFTEGWDYRPLTAMSGDTGDARELGPDGLVESLAAWIAVNGIPPSHSSAKPAIALGDLGHYCSHMGVRQSIDRVLAKYDRFCVAKQPSSIPYIDSALERLGKAFVIVPDTEPATLAAAKPFDCLLICGPTLHHQPDTPTVAIMKSTPPWRTFGVDPEIAGLHFSMEHAEFVRTCSDWYYPFPIDRTSHDADFEVARNLKRRAKMRSSRDRQHRLAERKRQASGEPAERRIGRDPRAATTRPDSHRKPLEERRILARAEQELRREQRIRERDAAREAHLAERRAETRTDRTDPV